MSLSPIIAKPVDFIGETLVKSDIATASEISAFKGIAGYAKRDGFLGTIATVLHRVWNAAKAIFGQSDWQRAHRAVISFTERNFTKLAETEEQKEEVNQMIAIMKSKEGHQKIDQLFGQVIGFIDLANEKVKPFEKLALPVVDQLLNAVNQDAVIKALKEDTENTLNILTGEDLGAALGQAVQKGFINQNAMQAVMMNNRQMLQMFAQ